MSPSSFNNFLEWFWDKNRCALGHGAQATTTVRGGVLTYNWASGSPLFSMNVARLSEKSDGFISGISSGDYTVRSTVNLFSIPKGYLFRFEGAYEDGAPIALANRCWLELTIPTSDYPQWTNWDDDYARSENGSQFIVKLELRNFIDPRSLLEIAQSSREEVALSVSSNNFVINNINSLTTTLSHSEQLIVAGFLDRKPSGGLGSFGRHRPVVQNVRLKLKITPPDREFTLPSERAILQANTPRTQDVKALPSPRVARTGGGKGPTVSSALASPAPSARSRPAKSLTKVDLHAKREQKLSEKKVDPAPRRAPQKSVSAHRADVNDPSTYANDGVIFVAVPYDQDAIFGEISCAKARLALIDQPNLRVYQDRVTVGDATVNCMYYRGVGSGWPNPKGIAKTNIQKACKSHPTGVPVISVGRASSAFEAQVSEFANESGHSCKFMPSRPLPNDTISEATSCIQAEQDLDGFPELPPPYSSVARTKAPDIPNQAEDVPAVDLHVSVRPRSVVATIPPKVVPPQADPVSADDDLTPEPAPVPSDQVIGNAIYERLIKIEKVTPEVAERVVASMIDTGISGALANLDEVIRALVPAAKAHIEKRKSIDATRKLAEEECASIMGPGVERHSDDEEKEVSNRPEELDDPLF
jgi:hypothetical protein